MIRSPLRYPGGKTRGVAQIRALIPMMLTDLVSPFFGGGSVELACASDGIRVRGYDAFAPLVDFWRCALSDADELAARVDGWYPMTRQSYRAAQIALPYMPEGIPRAAAYYALNRASFSGTVLNGGYSALTGRFTRSSIDRLRAFRASGVSVDHADWIDTIDRHPYDYLYLDPPYLVDSRLYGVGGDLHEGFNHALLAGVLRSRDNWLLSYNDCPEVRALYDGCEIVEATWTYGHGKRGAELLIRPGDRCDAA